MVSWSCATRRPMPMTATNVRTPASTRLDLLRSFIAEQQSNTGTLVRPSRARLPPGRGDQLGLQMDPRPQPRYRERMRATMREIVGVFAAVAVTLAGTSAAARAQG